MIDADFRGEVSVVLFNHSSIPCKLSAGSRIAQLLLERVVSPKVVQVSELGATYRGNKGFGSTGIGEVLQVRSRGNSVAEQIAKVRNAPKKIMKTPPSKKTVEEAFQQEPDMPEPNQDPTVMSPEAAEEAGSNTWNSSSFHNSKGFSQGHQDWLDCRSAVTWKVYCLIWICTSC